MPRRASRIHETAVVGPGVELGEGVSIGPLAVVSGPARIGDHVRIGPGAHVGGPPEISTARQNAAWDGDLDHHEIAIGSNTVLRDGVVIHHGSVRPTVIGERCWVFSHAYIAHDVIIEDDVTLSAGVSLGGHVTVRSGANLGLNVCVHQRRRIGALAMIGMGTPVTVDVPPYATLYGVPPRVRGINAFGMRRFGLAEDVIAHIEHWLAGTADPVVQTGGAPQGTDERSSPYLELQWWEQLPDRKSPKRAGP